MSFTIEYRDLAANRELRSSPVEDRDAALQQACELESTGQKCEVRRIVSDDGTEIARAEIDIYMVTKYKR